MVIAYLFVIHHSLRVSAQLQSGSKRKRAADAGGQLRHFPLHVMGQEPAVCTRIGQQFFLIESLRVFQRLLGGIAEDAVGIPLERGQVIEQRRILFLFLVLDLSDHSAVPVAGLRQAAGLAQVMNAFGVPDQAVAQIQLDGVEGLRLKMLDGVLTLTEHSQGRRHNPTNGQRRPIQERIQPCCVHPDEPVGLRTAQGCLIEIVIGGLVLHNMDAFPDRAFFHGGNP